MRAAFAVALVALVLIVPVPSVEAAPEPSPPTGSTGGSTCIILAPGYFPPVWIDPKACIG